MQEVFKSFEGFKSGKINLDNQGKSTGTGILVFSNGSLASKFVREYDNVELDGQPLKLEVETTRS